MTLPLAETQPSKTRAKKSVVDAKPMTLLQITAAMTQLDQLLEENGGELTPELEAQFDALGATFAEKVQAYLHKRQHALRVAAVCAAEEATATAEAKRFAARKKRCQALADDLERRLCEQLQARDIKEYEVDQFRVVRTANPYAVTARLQDAPVMRADVDALPAALIPCVKITPATAESYAWDNLALIARYRACVAARDEAVNAEDAQAVAGAELALAEVKQIALIERGERLTIT
jgi:hypothetical protein